MLCNELYVVKEHIMITGIYTLTPSIVNIHFSSTDDARKAYDYLDWHPLVEGVVKLRNDVVEYKLKRFVPSFARHGIHYQIKRVLAK